MTLMIVTTPLMEPGAFTASAAEVGAGPSVVRPTAQPKPVVITTVIDEYPYSSLLFTVADVVFFSYTNGTMLEL